MEHTPEESLEIAGPAGSLAARFRPMPADAPPAGGALLCHPHPLHGGTMHNKTLYRIAKRLPHEASVACLRFDFRGAGDSEGQFDHGVGEMEDARAALDELSRRVPQRPLFVLGYSFGAAVGLRSVTGDDRVSAQCALGLPLLLEFPLDFLDDTDIPLLVVQGERDAFGPIDALTRLCDRLRRPTELVVVPDADHLFTGHEDAAVDAVVRYLARHVSSE